VTWAEHTYLPELPAGYQAPNRVQNLRTYFTTSGPVIIPRELPDGVTLPWRWGRNYPAGVASRRNSRHNPSRFLSSRTGWNTPTVG